MVMLQNYQTLSLGFLIPSLALGVWLQHVFVLRLNLLHLSVSKDEGSLIHISLA